MDQWNPKEEVTELPANPEHPPFKIIIKGQCDIIMDRDRSFIIGIEGGNKRCGGIGDILAGVTGACGLWDFEYGPALASVLVRSATRMAFEKEGRGMTAPCVIEELSTVVKRFELMA